MFKWVTLEIWRKLFLAPRNLHAQVGRNLWHVESNQGIFFCINPFFYCPIFFKKKFKKLKLKFFSGFQSADFWVWFSMCSQNYERITKYFGFHIWNILWLIAFFGENSPFLKKLKEFANFFVFIGSTTADALFSADMSSCRLCASSSNDLVHPFSKG